MSSNPVLTCRQLSKTYRTQSGGIEALHAIDAGIMGGQVTALVGASGSGKSTLLRALAGLDRPTSGSLISNGHDLTTASPRDLRHHRANVVTYVSQKPADNLIPHLTLAQHAPKNPAHRILADVGLAHRLESLPIELSGGEQARAAFALALARQNPLILIDEPTAELDRDSSLLLLEAIDQHRDSGIAFVIATHDPDVAAIADNTLRLERGRLITHATPARATKTPRRDLTNEPPVLEARALAKSFTHSGGDIHAVTDATFTLRQGELGVLLGRSGSGKSTVLTLLAGWQQPDAGTIDPAGPATLDWAQLGYLPQRFGLIPELTVRENIELPARLTKTHHTHAARIDQLLHDLGLDELADRRPVETSIGQQQRTALARALILHPTLLIADEPTSHQDANWHDNVWALLAAAAADGTACLIATHEPEASTYATTTWEIDEGVLTQRRTPAGQEARS